MPQNSMLELQDSVENVFKSWAQFHVPVGWTVSES